MSGPVVKICGVRTVRHAQVAAEAGADMVGLVFAPSRRQVTVEEARAITGAAYTRRPRFVGVFVNERPEKVEALAEEIGLDMVQLSGDEPPEECARLRVPNTKVVHVRDGMTASDVLHIIGKYPRAEAILLDSTGTGLTAWGGTGIRLDPDLAATVVREVDRKIVLAGGLRPDSVAEAVAIVKPWGVDVSSGVETDGVKDETKIAAFVAAAKGARVRGTACDCGRMANHGHCGA